MFFSILNIIPVIIFFMLFVFLAFRTQKNKQNGKYKNRFRIVSKKERLIVIIFTLIIYSTVLIVISNINYQYLMNERVNILVLICLLSIFYLTNRIQQKSNDKDIWINFLNIFLIVTIILTFIIIVWAIFIFN